MGKYQARPYYIAQHPDSVTLVNGEAVALSGKDITVKTEGTATHPPTTRIIKGATQEQLKYLLETEKHPFIELVTETATK
ncbi:MAG: hypothetical protein ACRCYO_11565 [Bacteroidia bacterium]